MAYIYNKIIKQNWMNLSFIITIIITMNTPNPTSDRIVAQ